MLSTSLLTLNFGDIVRVDGKRGLGLVVRAERIVSEDRGRGYSYNVDEFDIVKFDAATTRWSLSNPNVSSYYFKGGSMHGKGIGIERTSVQVVGSAKVKTKVSVEYIFNSVKLA